MALAFVLASAVCHAESPHMGTWKLNEAKSKLAPGTGKSSTVVYAAKGDEITITVDGTDKDGKATHGVWTGKFDGKPHPVTGNLSWDSASYKTIDERTNEITAMKGDKVAWTGKVTVSADGKSRTVTQNGTDASGNKFSGEAVYDKQ